MPTPEAAYSEVDRLVKKFKALPTARRKRYNEADTRKDFILPLFRALEWNVEDAREVAAEEKISRGFVDFSFFVNGIRRFVLETKSLHEGLDNPEWARQAITYAYHKGVTWALLSDFQALRILNAEAKEQNPFQATFREFEVDDYLSRIEELWWLSRPAMLERILDREAEKVFKKSIRTPITISLFGHLKEWRQDLFKDLRAYNRDKRYSPKMIDDAVQRILDRLIFIRTAEDREVEGEKLIALVRELEDRGRINDVSQRLNQRFRELDGVYNSNLFAPSLSDDLKVSESATLVDIVKGMYGSSADYISYNFALIDADVLGRVYEQYLGVILSERKELKAKKAKRKSQGIYYTPTFVVKYIVEQTLGKYLQEQGYNPSHPVRVLDPACGSGSFLIEAFDVLDQFLAREKNQDRGVYGIHDHARQLQILTQNMYGVDKDEQAVEVARLNLMLKALHLRDRLPKLDNIRQGDSLISGSPKELEEYFGNNWKGKNPFDWEKIFPEVMKEGGFDVIVGNPPYVRIQTLPRDEVDFYDDYYSVATGNYDIYVLFVERALRLLKPGGVFGMILPKKFMQTTYGEGLRKLLADEKAVWKIVDFGDAQVFEQATTYTCLLFLQKRESEQVIYVKADDWLKEQAIVPDAIPNDLPEYRIKAGSLSHAEWNLAVGHGAALFERLSMMPVKLGDISHIFVGLQTSADTVFLFKKFTPTKSGTVRAYSKASDRTVELESDLLRPVIRSGEIGRYYAEPSALVLFPYRVENGEAHLLSQNELREGYPLTWDYLRANKKVLESREHGKFKGSAWYQLYPKNLNLWEQPKIMVPYMITRLAAYPDVRQNYYFVNVTTGGFGIVTEGEGLHLLYVTALLNSRLLDYIFRSQATKFHGGYFGANKQYIEELPIRRINLVDPGEKQKHDAVVALAEEMLQLQKDYAEAEREKWDNRDTLKQRIDEVDAEIDALVYKLYGLTEEEMAIVAEAGP